jgi:MSHA biogenesis protein MshJ
MKQLWEKISKKLNAMSVRERLMVFAAVAVLIVSLSNMFLLDPLFVKQKAMANLLLQQQQQLNEIEVQINTVLQENSPNSTSPRRMQIIQLNQEIVEGDAFLKSSRERLVPPEKMAEHLRRLLQKNSSLQMVSMQTLPASPLIEIAGADGNEKINKTQGLNSSVANKNQVYKHGVALTLRGDYLALMQYLVALEKLPQQMYWARIEMKVVKYPSAELTLTLYTLSLDKTWLQV